MRSFVALIEVMTADQDKAFIAHMSERQMAWWHWIDGSWLLLVPDAAADRAAAELRDALGKIAPSSNTMIFEVDVKAGWAGRGPKEEKTYFGWITDHWALRHGK